MRYRRSDRNPNRPDVIADDGASLHIANALYLWQNGDFSDWAQSHGFPIQIGRRTYAGWRGIETALATYRRGPYDPDLLDED